MKTCTKCKKEFNDGKYKNCIDCRSKIQEWKNKNKERISLYNKHYNDSQKNNTEITYIYAKKVDSEEWVKFETQLEAANILGLYAQNINKVLNGSLKTTGGYIFKKENETYINTRSWDEIKSENNVKEYVKGQPSNHRTEHETIDEIIGKKCCKCKLWKALENYNYCKNHWDHLRVECKSCISQWRKENREKICDAFKTYEKKRKQTDPIFKLMKTLRSRLGNALKYKSAKKKLSTLDLTGCSVAFLKEYLEKMFKDGMTWENHGSWHIDHIIPCSSFNLIDVDEQKKCFHYTNLQPLWAEENLKKGSKIIKND